MKQFKTKTEVLRENWKTEEAAAHIHGWDFSHLNGRYIEENGLPWDYETQVRSRLKPDDRILDIDTGGGEFLLSLKHPAQNTSATEAYPPNVKLCRETLLPLGIDFREAGDYSALPFDSASFHMVINRHGDFDPVEVYRILKPGGLFITQQVGEDNDRELVDLLLGTVPKPFPGMNCTEQCRRFQKAGFDIQESHEAYTPIRFFDVGALVWFARIIEWEFPGFTVDSSFEHLLKTQEILEKKGSVDGTAHRYLIVAKKPS